MTDKRTAVLSSTQYCDFGKTMKKKLYFAYGSNLNLEQMLQRCLDAEPVTQGILYGYSLTFKNRFRRWGIADIVPSPLSVVFGAVYAISDRDLDALDCYEGYPTLYTRKKVFVETREGPKECIVYVMQPDYVPALPSTFYFRTIWTGYQNWALPTEHLIEALERVSKEVSRGSKESNTRLVGKRRHLQLETQ